ncbi:MAG: FAD-dependent oxidoreductase [Actinomycetota bacterium]|nr:FAD-dependent oxidoreductase [Actinomycetota bacterium]
MSPGRIVVVGAGPCGIGCARELLALGHADFRVLEAAGHPGGLASSVVDSQGFTWDLGGHVVFSHYGEFDRVLAEVMGSDLLHHERSSFVRIAGQWVPYPFQNNLHHLPAELAEEAIVGLVQAGLAAPWPAEPAPAPSDEPAAAPDEPALAAADDFGSWMARTFGAGIVRQFMQPYNEKVWAHPAHEMSAGWIAERVSVVPWQQALHSLVHRTDDPGWGPNNLFAFPAAGGTGEIYRRAAQPLGKHISYDSAVLSIDPVARIVTTAGEQIHYDHLVWTGALDALVRCLASAPERVLCAADALVHNSVTVVGIGYEAPLEDDRSWLYFPEPDVPFYRATNFAKYAPANVPEGRTDRYSSWMTEIASSPWRPLERKGLAERVDAALRRAGLVPPHAGIASVHVEHIDCAYPVPTLGRDAALASIQPWLMELGIYSRGRFGAWRYELGNMDHAVKMGIDTARLLVRGTPEEAWS